MEVMTREDLDKLKEETEALKKQQEDSLNGYAFKVKNLISEINSLETRKSNLKKILDDAFVDRNKQVSALEEKVNANLLEAEKKHALVNKHLEDAKSKLDHSEDLKNSLLDKHNTHDLMKDEELRSLENHKEEMRQRESDLRERDAKSKGMFAEAATRISSAEFREKEIEEKANKLVHISDNVAHDIALQKELNTKNIALLNDINSKKEELNIQKRQAYEHMQESLSMRDDFKELSDGLALKQNNLNEKQNELRANEIRHEVVRQQQDSREQHINQQMGKLNQLKSDVEILLKKKESKGV